MSGVQGVTEQVLSSPVVQYSMGPLNDQNLIKLIVEAVNAEKQLWPLLHSKGLLHIDVLELYRKARSSYEKIILNDHELAELQDIEYSLWKLHYKHIDEYRNGIRQCSSDKDPTKLALVQKHNRDDLLEGFKSFLSEATEFYQDLITKIRRSYGFSKELLVFNEGSFSSSMESSEVRRCQFSCHRCLVCLGDLARYKELYGRPDTQNRNWSFAATHYLNASTIWPDSGSPQNQLAVLATYLGDELLALYHCIRSLAVKEPFPDAGDNLILLFEKNGSAHLESLSNEFTFNFFKPSERSTAKAKAGSSKDVSSEKAALWSLIVWMISFFYTKTRLEEFPGVFGSTIRQLDALFSLDDASLKSALEAYQHMDVARKGPFRALQLVAVLIFTIHTLCEGPQQETPKQIEFNQRQELIQHAMASAFICMGRFVGRCLTSSPIESNPLFPAILVFVEWLVVMLDEAQTFEADEKCENAMDYFFGTLMNLLNQLDDKGCKMKSAEFVTLWEDNELRGFLPVLQSHAALDFSNQRDPGSGFSDGHECQVRVCRILNAGMKIVNRSNGSRNWIFYEKMGRKFYTAETKEMAGGREQGATKSGLDLKVREFQQDFSLSKNVLPPIEESEEEVNEDDQNNIDVHKNSTLVEEEEVILFKPIRRYNSGPLPRNQIFSDPSGFYSTITGSRFKKTSWQDPVAEDSVTGHLVETNTDGVPSLAGPPSLSAWVLDRENLSITGEKGGDDTRKYGSELTEDIASISLTGLSIGGTALTPQEVKVTSSSPASHVIYGFSSEGDSNIGTQYSSSTDYLTPPYLPPMPSAPLLPDDATWSSSDSSNYSECKDLEDMKDHFLCASPVSNYSKFTGSTQGTPNFDPSFTRFSYGNLPLPDRIDYVQRRFGYHENLNLDQAHNNIWPTQLHSSTYFGRFHNHDLSKLALLDRLKNPLSPNPTKDYLDDLKLYPGLLVGGNEQSREKLSHGHQRPTTYGYDTALDLRSEQQLLLQYLKAKERRLQRESELRGPLNMGTETAYGRTG